jgi:type VI protein secretion system component VasK
LAEFFGSIWLFAVFGGAVLLGAAMAFGIVAWRRRSVAAERISEAATRANYRAEDVREKRKEAQEKREKEETGA